MLLSAKLHFKQGRDETTPSIWLQLHLLTKKGWRKKARRLLYPTPAVYMPATDVHIANCVVEIFRTLEAFMTIRLKHLHLKPFARLIFVAP